MPVAERQGLSGQHWKLDEVSSAFSLGLDRAQNTSPEGSQRLPLFSLQPEKDSLETSVIFLDKHITFMSQFSGNGPWIYGTISNNIFFFYGDYSWIGLDSSGESWRSPVSTK